MTGPPIGLAILARTPAADPMAVSRVSADGLARFAAARGMNVRTVAMPELGGAETAAAVLRDPAIDLIWAYGTTAAALPRPTSGHRGKPWISILANPPFYPSALTVIRLPDVPRHLVCVDGAMPDYIARLGATGADAFLERPAFQGEIADEAPLPLGARPIAALWAGVYRPPGQIIANLHRTPPDVRRFTEALIDAADQDFARPLWEIGDAVAAQLGSDLSMTDPRGVRALETASRFLTMRWKERVLRRLARHPCHIVANALPDGLALHPAASVSAPIPFPRLLALMAESRAVVGFMPNRMTGAVGERTTNAVARGAVAVVPDTQGLATLRAAGIAIAGYGPDLAGLDAALASIAAAPERHEDGARTAAATMRTRFSQAAALDEVFARVLGPQWARPAG